VSGGTDPRLAAPTSSGSPGHARPSATTVEELRSISALEAIELEWRELYAASGVSNPFARAVWQLEWMRHFTGPGEVRALAVRAGGRLVGMLPIFVRNYGPAAVPLLSRGRLAGMGRHASLTELPAVLTRPGFERAVLRRAVGHLVERREEWDWLELSLSPAQGWFEPEWAGAADGAAFAVHSGANVCVVLPLPRDWDALRQSFKRNVREAIRRSTNRLRRDGHAWRLRVVQSGAELPAALGELVRLHEARAAASGRNPHRNFFVSATHREFFDAVAPKLATVGGIKVALLEVEGRPVAATLLLRGNEAVYFSATGIDPDWWDYGVGTLLTAECLRDAVESGDRVANLSTGPTVAKLRWSEQLEQHNRFDVVNTRPSSRAFYGLFGSARSAAVVVRRGSQGPLPPAPRPRLGRPGSR
jgi:CelD/BcsL family acetyltransferase involved in cellulose biosynthesis